LSNGATVVESSLTATPRDFGKLHDILAPDPLKLSEAEIEWVFVRFPN
jgi:hypothetical protein